MYIRTRSEITFSAFSFPLYIFTAIRKIMANIHHSANMHLRIFFFFTSTSDYLTIKQGIINHERKKED